MLIFYLYLIGCLWAFDYGHKVLKSYAKVTPKEFIILIAMSLLAYITLVALFFGSKLKEGSDGK